MTPKTSIPEEPRALDPEEIALSSIVVGLRRLRLARRMSQKNLAFFSGVSARKISAFEKGTNQLEDLTMLADALKVGVSALFLPQQPTRLGILTRLGELLDLGSDASVVMQRIIAGPLEVRHVHSLGDQATLSELSLRHILGISASTYRDRHRQAALKANESDALLYAALMVSFLEQSRPGELMEDLFRERGLYQGRWNEAGGRFAAMFDLLILQ